MLVKKFNKKQQVEWLNFFLGECKGIEECRWAERLLKTINDFIGYDSHYY